MLTGVIFLITGLSGCKGVRDKQSAELKQGVYFDKKEYIPSPLPSFDETKEKLPRPIYDENPLYIDCYYKSWEIGFQNFYEPGPENGFVSQYIDAAFNECIFLWDAAFMTMFCNYVHPYIPGIRTLDNFYAKQFQNGEICREISRIDGKSAPPWVNSENKSLFSKMGPEYDYPDTWDVEYRGREVPTPNPVHTLDALNHPILAWAELESFKITGDTARLAMVYEPLARNYEFFKKYLRQGIGLYITDWASMDNSTRNYHLRNGGMGIDISSEMVLFAKHLGVISEIIGMEEETRRFNDEADELSLLINKYMWDKKRQFYFDLTVDDELVPIKTVAAFWPLLAGIASNEQAARLVEELNDTSTFNRAHRIPTLAANEEGYVPMGKYWKGGVWAPVNTMVIRGLENYGYDSLAREIAMNHLNSVTEVYRQTGTIWENYAPDSISPGNQSKPDFVGWSGIAPIAYLVEYAIGIKANASENTIELNVTSDKRVGIEKFWFGGKTIDLVCEESADNKRMVKIESDGKFFLKLKYKNITKEIDIPGGEVVEIMLDAYSAK